MTFPSQFRKPDSVCRDDPSASLPSNLAPFRMARVVPTIGQRAMPSSASASRAESIQRDLATFSESAEALLAGSKSAEGQLRNGIAAANERFRGSAARRDYDYGLVSAIVQLGDGLAVSRECRDGIAGRLRALHAAFTLDFAAASRNLALTRSAHRMMRYSLQDLRGSGSGRPGQPAPGGLDRPGFPQEPDAPGSGGSVDPLEPGAGDGLPPSFCEQLGDLIAQGFVDWAAGTDEDPWSRAIGNVWPRCARFDTVAGTEFHATPAPGIQFPPEPPAGVRLMFGGVDVTAGSTWSAEEIVFHLPAGSRSATLALQGPRAARNGLSQDVLDRILDLGTELIGAEARIVPGVAIGVIYPPEIVLFRVNGTDVGADAIVLEACRDAAQILWQVRMQGTPGFRIPDCARLDVSLIDETGATLAFSHSALGQETLPASSAGNTSVELVATVSLSGTEVGQVRRTVRLHRERRLRLEMRLPASTDLVAPQHATLRVTTSCAAPQGGTRIDLGSLPASLTVPAFVIVPEGSASTEFVAHVPAGAVGTTVLAAHAAGHSDAQVELHVVEAHTAVILSGGASKGDFEAGACSFLLLHRWHELDVQTIVGTSVGSINALGLAHNNGAETANRIEDQWLALRQSSDMFAAAQWLEEIDRQGDMAGRGVSLVDLALDFASGGGNGPAPSFDAAQFLLGHILTLGYSSADALLDLLGWAGLISEFLGGRGRDTAGNHVYASSLFQLDPARQRLADTLDLPQIAAGGLRVRLCMVSLHDGNVYYVDERGHLLHTARGDLSDEPIVRFGYAPWYGLASGSPADVLVAAAIASSAIPFFFAPVALQTGLETLTMVDGGVRETLPVRAAMELGAHRLICISASPADVALKWDWVPTKNLIDVGLRGGTEFPVAEVAREDRLEPMRSCRGDYDMIMIEPAPGVEVHNGFTVDSALTRINLAYGYMRAFDEFLRREDPARFDASFRSTEYIVQARLANYALEQQVIDEMDLSTGRIVMWEPAGRVPGLVVPTKALTAAALSDLRALKRDLMQLVYDRFVQFGSRSLPRSFGTPHATRSERIFDWWEHWEHFDPPGRRWEYYLLAGRPFDRQLLWDPGIGRYVRESTQVQPPVVPQDFSLAMAF